MSKAVPDKTVLNDRYIEAVGKRLSENKRIRRAMPGWGRLHIDRQLPFLCVYRKPKKGEDWGADRLAVTAAAYLLATSVRGIQGGLTSLVRRIAEVSVEVFGSCLIVEIWSGPETVVDENGERPNATFRIIRPQASNLDSTVQTLASSLKRIRMPHIVSPIEVREASGKIAPPGLSPLLTARDAESIGCVRLGLEVPPIFRGSAEGEVYPLVLKRMRRGLQRSLKRTFFEFTRAETTHQPLSYHALGRRAVVKAVWEVDRKLAQVSHSFDFLLLMTPINTDAQWSRFIRNRYAVAPRFAYRPLPIDPALIKRKLFECPIERIEDPTLANLFSQMQQELDRKLTMLVDRGTERLIYGSIQQFGGIDKKLLKTATDLLKRIPAGRSGGSDREIVGAAQFAARAGEEIAFYRATHPHFAARVEIRQDLVGLLVSRGNLLVGASTRVAESRVRALLQHEIGTHVLTYYNGVAQPFQTLHLGLPDYEELQEGLAVLSEYLVGGLSRERMRLLAARVVAVRRLIDGASFIEVFEELWKTHRFNGRTAFVIAMRVFRGGGLTKDAVYLRGLIELLEYLGEGGKLQPLLVGKVAIDHVPIILELQARKVLKPAPLWPRYLDEEQPKQRLAQIERGLSVFELT